MSARVVLGVTLLWTLVAVVSGAQASLAAALQGTTQALGPAITSALHQSLPWIPGTLAIIALTARFPLTRGHWRRSLPVHVLAMPAVAFMTNVLVVLGYWGRAGSFRGLLPLVQEGARWGLLRLHLAALLYAAAAAITQGLQSWRALRQRELELLRLEGQLASARLQALSAQIQPHFLFNTLHAIGQLWRSGRADEAEAMLDHLGALFQRVIASTARTQVALFEELGMVRDYLAIEQVRFGDRLRTRVDAAPAALSCLVPPLLLQPLVENAVKHGIAISPDGGAVTVAAHLDGDRLVLTVTDDGPGEQPETAGTGTGLANVRSRLEALFGDRQRLDRESNGSGTVVRLEIPVANE